ncbi:CotH kinase family protein [Marinilabiliaceae bacterium ANBcel2]|nr:CotH kinase family protein [Marinilabiliaceae bacterium ANBcel2]
MKLLRVIITISSILFSSFYYTATAEKINNIRITEIMASNSNTIADEEGDYEDWIEIHNSGNEPVNLNNWGLSDDETTPFRWQFPNITIDPGEYMIVWASGKNRKRDEQDQKSGIVREVWWNIPGANVDDLLNHPAFPGNPSHREIENEHFEAPTDIADEYGQRMHGLIEAPKTGEYRFWISGDDNSRLFLSSNESSNNQQLIAEVPGWTNPREWNKFSEQRSDYIHLKEGKQYYIAALMKEAFGGDNLAVRWELPDGTIEEPISASHIYTPSQQLHTNFAISSDGEPILLTTNEGVTIQYIAPTVIPGDISYGTVEGEEGYFYFNEPTPGEPNSTTPYNELIKEGPQFSHTGGFYKDKFDLTLTTDYADAEIIYTTDGSKPDPNNKEGKTYWYKNSYPHGNLISGEKETKLYEDKITITDRSASPYSIAGINTQFSNSPRLPRSNIFKGTVIRASIVKDGALSPKPVTHTYFITPEGKERFSLPVISITTDEDNLFDYYEGIYVAGKVADDWRENNPDGNFTGGTQSNYNQRGMDWEKNAHIEYFEESSNAVLTQNIGVRVHGGWSRANYMKSIRLYSRYAYDDDNTFHYPFFGELPADGNPEKRVTSFRRLMLRNSGNDMHSTMYRDALMQELVKELPFTTQAYQPVIHFINGEYWGIINMRERYDQHHISSHYNMDPEDVVILEANGNIDTGIGGDREHFDNILNVVETQNINSEQIWKNVKSSVDLENIAHYFAAQLYFHNTDWPHNNLTFWRKRDSNPPNNAPYGHDGKWRWMMYDVDFGMALSGNYYSNAINHVMGSSAISARLFRGLLENDDFRYLFLNTVADQLNSCFKKDFVHNTIDRFNDTLEPERDEHYNRWSSGVDRGQSMKTFASQRPQYVRSQTQNQFNLSGTYNLIVEKEGGGGKIKVNSLTIDKNLPGLEDYENPYPWSGQYFHNIPIKLKAVDTKSHTFSHWEGDHIGESSEREITIQSTQNQSVKAIFIASEREVIHYWHFNNLSDESFNRTEADISKTDKKGSIAIEGEGEGYMDIVDDGTIINSYNNTIEGLALRVRNPLNNNHLKLKVPTTNYDKPILRYAVKRTTNGPRINNIYYRTDNEGEWKKIKTQIKVTSEYRIIEADFLNIPETYNNDNFSVKIDFTGDHTAGSDGNNRFDNITLTGHKAVEDQDEEEENEEKENGEEENGEDKNGDKEYIHNIYPNPAGEEINIRSSNNIKRVTVYNIGGQKILQYHLPDNNKKISQNVSSLTAGIYIFEIVTSKETLKERVIIY